MNGQRVYLSNALYRSWEDQFYPDGLQGWLIKLDADGSGALTADPNFFLRTGQRCHQVRLEGGDASSDSYCYP